ncbi:MAG: hypothetical protein H0T53_05505 [Herpetosiphonaceae bacterium]|nr:hypothetical protein [Herpetosiphonaceae bacterium]
MSPLNCGLAGGAHRPRVVFLASFGAALLLNEEAQGRDLDARMSSR